MIRSLIITSLINISIFMLLAACSADAGETELTGPYFPKVKTIIQNNCISCHSLTGTGEPKGLPVQLDTDDNIVALAEAIKKATNDPVSLRNKRMPYGGELTATEKKIILKWFEAGGTSAD